MTRRARVDAELVRRGLARSRQQAAELIGAGRVSIDGMPAAKPATAIALSATRLMASLLFGVGVADPVTFTGVVLLLGATALLACAVPAWRAMRVQPAAVLRNE